MRILGVHGVGFDLPWTDPTNSGRHLAASWTACLSRALRKLGAAADCRIEIEIAYYRHLLAEGLAFSAEIDPERIDEADLRKIELDEIDTDALDRLSELLEFTSPEGAGFGPLTKGIRRKLSTLMDAFAADPRYQNDTYPPAAKALFAIFTFRQIETYLSNKPRHDETRDLVANKIQKYRPHIVLGHSLGSVVAYEALHAAGTQVDMFITAGSPLAIPTLVFERLDPRGLRPPGVGRWVNIADPGDFIAIPPGGIAAKFADLDQDRTGTIGWLDFHSAVGYLGSPALAGTVADYLGPAFRG